MSNPPRILLNYRPVRIGWLTEARDVAQLATAASWSTCLWGGQFNPIIPIEDRDFSDKLIRAFGVDVLIPIAASNTTKAFVDAYPHLRLKMWGGGGVFRSGLSEFVDIRHAVRRATGAGARAPLNLSAFARPIWLPDDAMAAMLSALFGRYPSPEEITLDYVAGIRRSLAMPDRPIDQDAAIPAELSGGIGPIHFTAFDLSWRRLDPGIVLGDATDFDDLLLFWNLQAAGAPISFFDRARAARCKPFVDAFFALLRGQLGDERRRINLWGRGLAPPWNPESLDLDISGLEPCICGSGDARLWNGMNIRPCRPQFSTWKDVVASYTDGDTGATASFALPDRPFDDQDAQALNQHLVVIVDAHQYGATSDDLTFETPYVPRLNEFYGRNFHFGHDKARSERSFGHGAVGLITTVGTQRLEARAFRVHDWLRSFFELVGIGIERSEPGLRSARLIRQFGGLRTSHVLKVRGARELIRKYGPDQNFTRSEAEKCIGNFDESTERMRFSDFEDLYIQPRSRGKLTPGEVLQYMTARGVFRVGLEFKCPTCELRSWHHLDDVRTISTCAYCGQGFDVTAQLKDRDWRYRRSGLFGRDDNQLGGIPVALALQQLENTLHDSLLMYATASEFSPKEAAIERCEADFIAVVAGAAGESPVQILFGEAKTHTPIDATDVRKLGKLADAIPRDLAQTFILFAKTDTFTPDEIALAQTLNEPHRRVILWSQEELEPYHVYERSKDRLGPYGTAFTDTLPDMARITHKLWFVNSSSSSV